MKGQWKTLTNHIATMRQEHQGPRRPKYQCPHALSLSSEHTSCNRQSSGGLTLAFFNFFPQNGGYTRAVVYTVVCACVQFFSCPCAHAGCHRTTRVYVGPTFLKVSAPPKNKIKCIKEELKCKRG
jgi:hypothetical protein